MQASRKTAPDRTEMEQLMSERDNLQSHLSEMGISPEATAWLLGLWDAIQLFDDVADGDPIPREDLDRVIYSVFVEQPLNPFWQRNSAWLIPACAQMVLEWQASDRAERNGRASPQSYMWRAGYYRVACLVAALELGPTADVAEAALSLYGETVGDYAKEFPECQAQ